VNEHENWLHCMGTRLADKLTTAILDREQHAAKSQLSERDYYRDVVIDLLNEYARACGLTGFAEMDRELSPKPRVMSVGHDSVIDYIERRTR